MSGTRLGAWIVGGVIGSALAILANAMVHWLGFATPGALREAEAQAQRAVRPPPAIGQKLLPEQTPHAQPATTPPEATPTPVPNRNEIRLPLPPLKRETGPLQVQVAEPPFDPNAADANGRTLLMRAAEGADVAEMERLLCEGAEINQRDRLAHTALYYAILAKSGPVVEWLITNGAEVDCPCCDGAETPLWHALATGELRVIEPILRAERPAQWCRPAREALFTALLLGDKPFIRALLAYHQSAPTLEASRQPLLGYAVAWGNYSLLTLLLECGANPNTPLNSPVDKTFSRLVSDRSTREYLETESGMTPLMLASATGRIDCVQALLQYAEPPPSATK